MPLERLFTGPVLESPESAPRFVDVSVRQVGWLGSLLWLQAGGASCSTRPFGFWTSVEGVVFSWVRCVCFIV